MWDPSIRPAARPAAGLERRRPHGRNCPEQPCRRSTASTEHRKPLNCRCRLPALCRAIAPRQAHRLLACRTRSLGTNCAHRRGFPSFRVFKPQKTASTLLVRHGDR
jgi:hypothetical protein